MGVGPRYAIPVAVEKAGLKVGDIDVFEINEAFASQALWSVKELGIPLEKVNPLGGAIALGHPLGCTGARQIATLLHQLRRTKKRFGVVSMCIGTGMGAAGVRSLPLSLSSPQLSADDRFSVRSSRLSFNAPRRVFTQHLDAYPT